MFEDLVAVLVLGLLSLASQ